MTANISGDPVFDFTGLSSNSSYTMTLYYNLDEPGFTQAEPITINTIDPSNDVAAPTDAMATNLNNATNDIQVGWQPGDEFAKGRGSN